MTASIDLQQLIAECAQASPQAILKQAFAAFGDELWLSFSGAEDVVLLDMAWKINPQVNVFSLDTGRLHPETYQFLEQVREHYKISIEVLSPDAQQVQNLVREKAYSASIRMATVNAVVCARLLH